MADYNNDDHTEYIKQTFAEQVCHAFESLIRHKFRGIQGLKITVPDPNDITIINVSFEPGMYSQKEVTEYLIDIRKQIKL